MFQTVSVALAAYNGERFLATQLDSILSQLKERDELVVSYDNSSDGTRSILDVYAARDPRVKVFDNSQPGIVGNFNNAIAHCINDVIFISDQDDVWRPGKREKMLAVLNETGADLAIHNVVNIDEAGKVISKSFFEEYGIGPGLLRNFSKPRYSGCCMAFPSASRRLIMPMPESVENYDHWIGMVCEAFGSITFVDDVLLYHRIHGNNATVTRRPLGVVIQQRSNLLRALRKKKGELAL